jgi:hypothetical protein
MLVYSLAIAFQLRALERQRGHRSTHSPRVLIRRAEGARAELAKGIGINRVAKLVGLNCAEDQGGNGGIVMPSPLLYSTYSPSIRNELFYTDVEGRYAHSDE